MRNSTNDDVNEIPAVSVFERKPDVEAIFEFNGARRAPIFDGYRPAHRIKDDYLTSGLHHYFQMESVPPDGTVRGTITFITPEAYPQCLWLGKRISIQEGERIVGWATITQILNPLLRAEKTELNADEL